MQQLNCKPGDLAIVVNTTLPETSARSWKLSAQRPSRARTSKAQATYGTFAPSAVVQLSSTGTTTLVGASTSWPRALRPTAVCIQSPGLLMTMLCEKTWR